MGKKRAKGTWVFVAQSTVIMLMIGLVTSFFIMAAIQMNAEGEESSPEATPEPSQGEPGEGPEPGVPAKPISDMEMWPELDNQNADRQLDYEASGEPKVELPEALSDDLTGYWEQELSWEDCGGDQCATVKVPLDWENPGEAALDIRVRKIPSDNPSRGPLFVNPGGPGFGGQDFAQGLGKDAWEGYDIVGWDPRGTGESTAVQCGTLEETDAMFDLDTTPASADEMGPIIEGFSRFAQECRDASGPLLDHITTIENVRDLDLIRALMGADKLNYVGVSYGTYVGSVYAQLFPDRVGRLVLDAAVNITDDDSLPTQAEGFELALRNFSDWCAGESGCPLGDSQDDVMNGIASWLEGLDDNPIPVGDRNLTQELATTGIAMFLYDDENAYETLAGGIQMARSGDGELLLRAADMLNSREPDGYDTSAYAFPATSCVDAVDQGVDGLFEDWEALKPDSPVFAANMGLSAICETWTADSAPQVKLTAEGAPPIVVVGTTGDSATPYENAVSMAEQLDSGVLLTYEGAGHGAVTSGNQCITEAINKYLLDGEAPSDGQKCS